MHTMSSNWLKTTLIIGCSLLPFQIGHTQQSDLLKDIEAEIAAELADLGDIYKVTAPSDELATKAAITFHGQLLESEPSTRSHILTLTEAETARLKSFGFKIETALVSQTAINVTDWDKWRPKTKNWPMLSRRKTLLASLDIVVTKPSKKPLQTLRN